MKITGDQALVKKINKSIVLDTIRRHGPLSRIQVSEKTGLNKATVSNLVLELLANYLVEEIGPGESSGGRKPTMLLFHRSAGHAIGLELSVTHLTGILTDLEDNIVAEYSTRLTQRDFPSVLDEMHQAIRSLMQKAPSSPHGVVGIGVGVPGMVDDSGTILFAPNLGWEKIPLKDILEDAFSIPVTIDNEANAGAEGELHYGAGIDVHHLIYISAGMGIGSGIIVDGQLYKGARGYAGETGHMTIEANGSKCSCGNQGCWELYASEITYGDLSKDLPAHTTQELIPHALQHDPAILGLFNTIGHYLGIGITNIINSFNPELIIIGGPLAEAKEWLESPLQSVVAQRTLPYHRSQLQVQFSALGSHSTMLGASYAAVSQFLGRVRVSL
ncbi:ROK family protein [Paenibacillus crassostreae]|uniref:ROK family protein n=1 Tax=Paenibacillus crassostreae TaxID=1763538 RepID=A0A167ETX2_9BACL|nr:ROK family protein [Paenibacillus crassostreae]AOZ93469.1 ROK family protein [Paenibacillus crassostreae]OAB75876.1 ROK family protein [Paenibacillus crassostreae]